MMVSEFMILIPTVDATLIDLLPRLIVLGAVAPQASNAGATTTTREARLARVLAKDMTPGNVSTEIHNMMLAKLQQTQL